VHELERLTPYQFIQKKKNAVAQGNISASRKISVLLLQNWVLSFL